MKRILQVVKIVGVFLCISLLPVFMFFDVIDWLIPGDFPEWVYGMEIIAWVAFGVTALIVFVKKWRKQ